MSFGLFVILDWLAGFLLVYSGLIHLTNPFLFFDSVLKYELLPIGLAKFLALSLPIVQLVCGCWLCTGFFLRQARVWSSILFGMFALAQWSVLWRGMEVGCGCFGGDSRKITVVSASGVLAISILLLVAARQTGDDRVLFHRTNESGTAESGFHSQLER